jgi:hypothetical protein
VVVPLAVDEEAVVVGDVVVDSVAVVVDVVGVVVRLEPAPFPADEDPAAPFTAAGTTDVGAAPSAVVSREVRRSGPLPADGVPARPMA